MARPAVVDPLAPFHPSVRAWFGESFPAPTPAQRLAFPPIAAGRSVLLVAPTGSGKTLAAFLAAIDRLAFSAEPAPTERLRVLYISPLKALGVDVERNLRAPLVGIGLTADRLGAPRRNVEVAVRTGDTPAKERVRFAKAPSDILITTPESLFLMLTSDVAARLASVDVLILDEIHAVAGTKRGAHLAISLLRGKNVPARLAAVYAPGLSPMDFHAVAEAPVAAQANAGSGIPQVGLPQRMLGLGIEPTFCVGMRGLGADAGDFGKGLGQLGLYPFGVVVDVFL